VTHAGYGNAANLISLSSAPDSNTITIDASSVSGIDTYTIYIKGYLKEYPLIYNIYN